MKRITSARQIGQVIRKKRNALGLTQQQLADAAHVSRGFINRIEKGTSAAVYPDKLLDVLAALDLCLSIEERGGAQSKSLDKNDAASQPYKTSDRLNITRRLASENRKRSSAPSVRYSAIQIDPALLQRHSSSHVDVTLETPQHEEKK